MARPRKRPASAVVIDTYGGITPYVRAFADNNLSLLIIIGNAGLQKSRQLRAAAPGDSLWVEVFGDNQYSPLPTIRIPFRTPSGRDRQFGFGDCELRGSLGRFESVAGDIQFDDHAVVHQTVDGCGGRHRILEDGGPL